MKRSIMQSIAQKAREAALEQLGKGSEAVETLIRKRTDGSGKKDSRRKCTSTLAKAASVGARSGKGMGRAAKLAACAAIGGAAGDRARAAYAAYREDHDLDALDAEIARLEAEIDDLDEQIAQLDLDMLQDEIDALDDDILELDLEMLEDDIEELQDEIDELDDELDVD
ncbi:MAG: hypothetical protein IJU05_00015, partial [Schwartzia sp.]|nr:hypothetical protein [Schwartzia sp. (in: firmicutes)]